jgi:hypothetical protein
MSNVELTKAARAPIPEQAYRPARSPEELAELIAQLQASPEEWFIYSTHKTRGSARQRVLSLKRSQTYEGHPLQWRTQRAVEGDPSSQVHVLVSWESSE